MIKVSIIMPSLNVAGYIRECMESAVQQTMKEIEIICVDAGSTDGTRKILQEYAQRDNRISIIDSNVKSYGMQVNMGIMAAKGEYIAILETDDYVLNDMYEKLYGIAQKNALDYVMADFKSFYDDAETGRNFFEAHALAGRQDLYHKVLTLKDHAHLYGVDDSTLWRGIYARSFLLANGIRLNETPGAAYQDICFMHRVRMNAVRSMYINEFGYCYRTDRDGSSINSVKGLQYARYEYQYLSEHDDIPPIYMGKALYMMSSAFVGECINLLPRTNYSWEKEDEECYEWFKMILTDAIKEGQLTESMGEQEWWRSLGILLTSKEDFVRRVRAVSKNYEEIKHIFLSEPMVIICGAGMRGRGLVRRLKKDEVFNGRTTILFADNNQKIWNSHVDGVQVLSVCSCADKNPKAVYVIANKTHGAHIREQLVAEGISEEKIYEYKPFYNFID